MSYTEITRMKFWGGKKLPDNIIRVLSTGKRGSMQISTNISEQFQANRNVKESGSETVRLGIAYDPDTKSLKLLPSSLDGFMWSQKNGSALRVNMPKRAIEVGIETGDYLLNGPSELLEFTKQ